MHVILLTSLFGEKRGNVGDKLPVASQEEADELVKIGIARYDTEAELKRQLAEYQARAAEESAKAGATEEEPKGKQVKAKTDKA
ncbi:hypothetical protein [Aeromonas media]|uniref:hypothetical protein n=1 Tax=Aeromonas media TaxID=651 RepID=UPI00148B26A5|nr:hypothetical protein [Aeromonas media]